VKLRKGPLEIRTLGTEDKGELVKWLSDPNVLQYYEGRDNPFNLEKVEEKFYQLKKMWNVASFYMRARK
jgi:aminoglycoside 6'-N-acetyltransferase